MELFDGQRAIVRSINLVPLSSISDFLSGSSVNLKQFALANVGGNILIFIPLGVYVSVLRNNHSGRSHLLLILSMSLAVEVIQGLLGIGTADIDDILLNGLGGWIGIFACASLRFLFREEKNVRAFIAALSALVGVPVMFYLLFMIKMRF
ncbi:VanZ family protein [Paenibacillus artemisiicola]|uniref:VanZ family protein n=1 Tax=Paenibacillus artemisiicola TaxID=1172618 RepID=UPI001F0AA8C3